MTGLPLPPAKKPKAIERERSHQEIETMERERSHQEIETMERERERERMEREWREMDNGMDREKPLARTRTGSQMRKHTGGHARAFAHLRQRRTASKTLQAKKHARTCAR